MKRDKNTKYIVKRVLWIVLCVILSMTLIASMFVAVAVTKYKKYQGLINYTTRVDIVSHPLYTQVKEEGKLVEDSEEIINLLLVGQDAREGQGRQRSDAMILLTINMKTDTMTMTSFMRDLYVEIPEHGYSKLNAAYAWGGADLLNLTLLKNFGIVVDANVEIDFQGFMKAIDVVGGVDVELSQSEVNFLQRNGNWGVTESAWAWDLKAGMNHLSGDQALAYCRDRFSDGTSDFGRTARQRKVLNALFNKCKNLSMNEIDALMVEILPLVTTNMTQDEMNRYITLVLPAMSKMSVKEVRIPADGTYQNTTRNEMSVLVPDLDKNRQILMEAIN